MIRVDTSEAEAFLEGMFRDQVPFAASVALNRTAKDAQRALQANIAGTFTLRRADFILRETAKIPRFSHKNDPELAVEILATDRVQFMRKFEQGIPKESITGGSIAVPIAARPSKGELVPKLLRPRQLKLQAHRTASGKVQLKGRFGTFAIRGLGILQRAEGQVRLLYRFRKRVPTPAVLKYQEIGQRVVRAVWPGNWARAFAEAIRSVKR